LQNVKNEFDPPLDRSLQQLRDEIALPFITIQNDFYKKYQENSDQVNILKTLYKEAEIKQNKKLQQAHLFSKNQSIKKYSDQLANLKKLVDKASLDDIAKINEYIITMDKELRGVNDKIATLQRILQPQNRRKKTSKTAPVIKQPVEKKQDAIPVEPTPQNNVVEILDDEERDTVAKSSKKKKRKPKLKTKLTEEEKSASSAGPTIDIPSVSQNSMSCPSPIKTFGDKLQRESNQMDPRLHGDDKDNLASPVEKKNTALKPACMTNVGGPIQPSSHQQLGFFKSEMVRAVAKALSNTPTDTIPYSYGLLIRCKNNKYLHAFAKKITSKIKTFKPSKELLSQPHISLFFVEDLKLNDEKLRQSLIKDLQIIFALCSLPTKVLFTKISALGLEYNTNKFISLEIEPRDQLHRIYQSCIQLFKKYGIVIPKQPDFVPHLTLGYSKEPITQLQLNTIDPALIQRHIELDVSILNRKPPVPIGISPYLVPKEELASFHLNLEENQQLKLKI